MKSPKVVQIYLDTMCNLNCFFCLVSQDKADTRGAFRMSNLDEMANVIKKAEVVSISAIGEPFLSPHFQEALEKIYSLNSKPVIAIVTNGTVLTKEHANLLRGHLADLTISINTTSPERYKTEMGGDWNKTIQHVKEFISESDKSNLGLFFGDSFGDVRQDFLRT